MDAYAVEDLAATDRIWSRVARDTAPKPLARRRGAQLTAVGIAAALLGGVGTSVAYGGISARPSVESSSLGSTVQDITAAMSTASGRAGFTGLVVNPSAGSIDLYWKGAVSEEVQRVIADHPEVEVDVHSAAVDLRALQQSQTALEKWLTASTDPRIRLIEVGPTANGGLEVTLSSTQPDVTVGDIQSELDSAAGMPVNVVLEAYGSHDLEPSVDDPTVPLPGH